MTAFSQYVLLDKILREQNEEMMKEVMALMQKNISIAYVGALISKHTNVNWSILPANEVEDILKVEGLITHDYHYVGRDDTHGCIIFMPAGQLAGSVRPETIIQGPIQ